jgi:hypothetical protein
MSETTENVPANLPDEQSQVESLNDKKVKLEIKKLEKELAPKTSGYFYKTILPVLIPAAITAIVTAITIYFLYSNLLIDVKEKSIDTKTKYDETVLKTIEVTQKRDALNKEVADFETRKTLLTDSLTILNRRLQGTSQSLEEASQSVIISKKQAEAFKQESKLSKLVADEKSDSLKITPLVIALKNIDATPDFSYDKNRLSYDDFVSELRKNNEKICNGLLNNYINSDKLYGNKLLIAMIAYKNLTNKEAWFDTYLNLLDSGICYLKQPRTYVKTINCKEWDDDEYHKIIVYIIDHAIKTRFCKTNAYNLLNSVLYRSDVNLGPDKADYTSFLDFLSLYKESVLKRESFALTNINRVINIKSVSKEISKAFLSEYILTNKESFINFTIELAKDQKKMKSILYQLNNITSILKITQEEFLSIDFWGDFHKKNAELISRLMESDFETYRKKPVQLQFDMQL